MINCLLKHQELIQPLLKFHIMMIIKQSKNEIIP